MERQRGELVPIGKVVSGLDGPVQAIRDATPQSLHHFTQADQVNQLAAAREADPDRGFMARMMALCSLPRTNPGTRIRYTRQNGPYTLYMTAGGGGKLPFGNLPRLLLAWLSTEAVRTQTRLRNQMDRLFHASVQLIYEDEGNKAGISSFVADRTEFWWNERKPDQSSLWQSKIELSEKFFNEIIRHPVLIDMNILKSLKRSSLGIDFYLWVTYRTFTLKRPLRLSWARLYRQLGVNPAKVGATGSQSITSERTVCVN